MAKRVKEPMPESGLIKVDDPVLDAPVDIDPAPEPAPAPKGPAIRAGIRRFFSIFFRLVFWVIVFTVFGAALYYGLPMLYQRFVVPVEQNTAQMIELRSQQQALEQQLADLQDKFATLEAAQEQNAQSVTDLDERASQLEINVTAHSKSLAALETMQSQLQAQDEAVSVELQRQIDLVKSRELLSRARLYMYQSNFGLAEQDVKLAYNLLVDVQPNVGEPLADDLDAVISRLDLVLANLPSFPVAASDDLDIAWQILVTGLPEASASATVTPVIESTPSVTPEATFPPTPPATPTP